MKGIGIDKDEMLSILQTDILLIFAIDETHSTGQRASGRVYCQEKWLDGGLLLFSKKIVLFTINGVINAIISRGAFPPRSQATVL